MPHHRRPLPPLGDYLSRKRYLAQHLSNELHWVLYAATEWQIQSKLKLKITGYMTQAYAMDSTFLHARTLFEFFTKPTSRNYYGSDQFLGPNARRSSTRYKDWQSPLHAFLMHAQDRSRPRKLKSFQSPRKLKHLKNMPVDLANEILRLWMRFERDLGKQGKAGDTHALKLQTLARKIRETAIRRADSIAISVLSGNRRYNRNERIRQRTGLVRPVFRNV